MKNVVLKIGLLIATLLGFAGSVMASNLPDCPEYRHPTSSPWHNCFGTFTYSTGNKYVGEWRLNKQFGFGTVYFTDGQKYVGNFDQNQLRSGQGTYIHADGGKYVGEFKDGKQHGHGISTFGPSSEWSGDKYVGEWKDGNKHGQGAYTYANGNKYVGGLRDDLIHGQGTYSWVNGNKYVGEFRNGEYHGQGTFIWAASGNKYVGEYRNNKRNGQGTFTHKSGTKEVGEWANGKLNGYAIRYDADGSILKEGIWKDDEFLYAEKRSENVNSSSGNSKLVKHKEFCEEIGFTPGTEKFAECVMVLIDTD